MPGRRFAALFLVVATTLAAEQVSIRVLATTDLHGNLYPVDYYTGRPANRGLAKLATLVRAERTSSSLLIDCGDTIQGSPVEYVYQTFVRTGHWPLKLSADPLSIDPMMLAMNHLGYDAMVLGNHEFNFGLKNLRQAREQARFPWLSANTAGWGQPYLIKTVGGVKIAVIGVTTPSVPNWEKPENYAGYGFRPAREAVESALQDLRRERPDLVIVASHAGRKGYSDIVGENPVDDLVTIPGIDAIVFGHTHQELPQAVVNGVLLCQPKNWGMSL